MQDVCPSDVSELLLIKTSMIKVISFVMDNSVAFKQLTNWVFIRKKSSKTLMIVISPHTDSIRKSGQTSTRKTQTSISGLIFWNLQPYAGTITRTPFLKLVLIDSIQTFLGRFHIPPPAPRLTNYLLFSHYPVVDLLAPAFNELASQESARWFKWLECKFTDRKVHGSNPTSAPRFLLSRLGQPGGIPALVLPSGGITAPKGCYSWTETCAPLLEVSHPDDKTSLDMFEHATLPLTSKLCLTPNCSRLEQLLGTSTTCGVGVTLAYP
ncbi:LOW QUALITY PROTEIN: hypothetical protein T265_14619 [Opisthorchis viverrini]|uniref:Uncharacterized protein n=1 Tax=Opisthorchis viverrini TaxID=6198 RepID=A0A075A7Z4_OPIVI|nr:LOW QUALITY PROTEIN: hypothetical protein T265_14619 [Opisthorchis viverrini]KER23589.1 LOW QUALITY PROTEIN: hypothetical protein T265_14619 [Opisthorchis viverrini]